MRDSLIERTGIESWLVRTSFPVRVTGSAWCASPWKTMKGESGLEKGRQSSAAEQKMGSSGGG